MPFSSYLLNKLVDHAFGSGTFSKPTLYLGLTVSGVEVSTSGGSNYARKATSAFTVSSNTATLADDVDFDVAGTNWGTIDGVVLYDAVSGGNQLGTGSLSSSKVIEIGDVFRALAGEIDIELT
jgi:hypothetical protein